MTQQRADDFLNSQHPELADRVEDYECRGGTHFYFLDAGQIVKINRRRATLIHEAGPVLCQLAAFNS
jgi:hypothetical protein